MKYFWIQLVLILGSVSLALMFIRNWDQAKTRAWKRIAFSVFVLVNVYAVLRPTDVTWLAHQLGVGRGTDLVLYVMVLAMGFLTLNTFLRFRSLEKKITDLARTVALSEGARHNDERLGPDAVRQPAPVEPVAPVEPEAPATEPADSVKA
ncbi:DUF2304 domain-containing protein [Streptomyces sp. ZAF1911]|uniref:DUF2304 domain-containing protein n=1 Tax=unclassified Streptomyces TaxID=2593676 RepID=UPI00225C0E01|nr:MULTISPECIES: DUF2304 domain-containing protein [unclassified Streptomyces]MCX5123136.1 DUF2304 domain-containing protein [Streptomyces sp. NBC_00347]MCX5296482.1 DUF2304 domain-containing protein [Streptomyces sp. NBC_00193]MDD9378243.1 DUF2304 domain-containing protein [Streptomyces sp. ZAF1911]